MSFHIFITPSLNQKEKRKTKTEAKGPKWGKNILNLAVYVPVISQGAGCKIAACSGEWQPFVFILKKFLWKLVMEMYLPWFFRNIIKVHETFKTVEPKMGKNDL